MTAVIEPDNPSYLLVTMDQPLNPANQPPRSDFTFSSGAIVGGNVNTSGFGSGFFILERTTPFTLGEVVTFSYTPNADPSKVLQDMEGDEVLPIVNYAVDNNIV